MKSAKKRHSGSMATMNRPNFPMLAVASLLVLNIVTLTASFARNEDRVVRATAFVVVDAKGNEVGRFTTDKGTASLHLMDSDGDNSVFLSSSKGAALMGMLDINGDTSVQIKSSAEGISMKLGTGKDKPYFLAGVTDDVASVGLQGTANKARTVLLKGKDRNGLSCTDPESRIMAALQCDTSGSLMLYDAEHKKTVDYP